jgi:molybdenum cofactor cytidylyltransferase
MSITVGLILLAAGASHRLGQPKQLLQFNGKSLLRHAAETAAASECKPVMVVLGSHADRLREEVSGLDVQVVENAAWENGVGTSIRAGVHAMQNQNVDAAVMMLCDQPFITTEMINRLIHLHVETKKAIVASAYNNTLGVPVLFGRSVFADILALNDWDGAKSIIMQYATETLPVDTPAAGFDVDTPDDYDRLLSPNI